MSDKENSAERESIEDLSHPFYILNGEPLNCFIDLLTMHVLNRDQRSIAQRWGLIDRYEVISPDLYNTVRLSPVNCIAVCDPDFETGVRFPFHPFIRQVLDFLNIMVAEIYPNAWGCMVAFV